MSKSISIISILIMLLIISCTNSNSDKKTMSSDKGNQKDSAKIVGGEFSDVPEKDILKGKVMDKSKYPDDLFVIMPSDVTSSGYLKGSNEDYSEDFMIDHDPFTWWTPNPNRNGEGAWIQLNFDENVEINGFEIWGGSHNPDYPEYGDIYKLNNRVKRGVCEFSDGSKIYFELKDIDNWQLVRFTETKETKTIKLKIYEVYKGEKWDDLCIAEFLALSPTQSDFDEYSGMAKPVIYLYPNKIQDVNVQLATSTMKGTLDLTYPNYGKDGWNMTAFPNGKLIDKKTKKSYNYLFWEGTSNKQWEFPDGFIVKGTETAEFLEEKLSLMGLTANEYNDFIVYWLPLMVKNEYNLIRFPNEEYNKDFPLKITPKPESVLRIYMVFKAVDSPYILPEQELQPFNRKGFTVVEWGGSQLDNSNSIHKTEV